MSEWDEHPPGVPGEIVIHTLQIVEGNWKRPAKTGQMIRQGWVYTGVIGYMDKDGYLFLIDRKKDMIKPSSFLV